MEDVEFLRGLKFSWTYIAQVLGVSRSTLYRRLDEEGVSFAATYTDISDVDLDRIVSDIKSTHPNDGERLLSGYLCRVGICVPRTRLRASIHRTDPVNTALQRSVTVRRRVYHAEGPNAVWHIDGNHKLIKWRFVVHGGIDGFSRTIVYLKCADNNQSDTVLRAFTNAVQEHGLPNRIRSDLGGENVSVWRYTVEQHSSSRAVITGSSTHNERIERLWWDVNRCVGVLFADTFRRLEEEGHLDCLNEVDVFCLHYVYLPRIQSALNAFVEAWNNHTLSTERSLTPNQLFIHGALQQNMSPQQPRQLVGMGSSQPLPYGSVTDPVVVPRVNFRPCNDLRRRLSRIDCLGESLDFGSDIYLQVVRIVGHHLLQNCVYCV